MDYQYPGIPPPEAGRNIADRATSLFFQFMIRFWRDKVPLPLFPPTSLRRLSSSFLFSFSFHLIFFLRVRSHKQSVPAFRFSFWIDFDPPSLSFFSLKQLFEFLTTLLLEVSLSFSVCPGGRSLIPDLSLVVSLPFFPSLSHDSRSYCVFPSFKKPTVFFHLPLPPLLDLCSKALSLHQ